MLIRVARPQPPVHEFSDDSAFGVAMQQAAGIRRNDAQHQDDPRQPVEVWIQVWDARAGWLDWERFWEGYWSADVPMPPRRELYDAMKAAGAQRARAVTRSTI